MVELRKHCNNIDMLRNYCLELVPRIIRHNTAIVCNQMYYVALHVRKIKSLSFDKRKELCEGLLSDVSITGVSDCVYDFEDVLSEIDVDKLITYVSDKIRPPV